jgi:uncharacterized membrane protein
MLNGAIFTVLTGTIWTLLAVVYSNAASKLKQISGFMLFYSIVFAALIWIFQTPDAASANEIGKVAMGMVPSALLGHAGFFALFLAMKRGSHAVAWTFTQTAMVMPFLGSWLLFGNKVTILNCTGLFLIVCALAGLGVSKNSAASVEKNKSYMAVVFSLIAMLLTGISQFCSLLPNELEASEAALTWRLPISTSTGILVWGTVALINRAKINWQIVKSGSVYGLVVAAGQVTLYISIDYLKPVNMVAIVYPTAVSMCIVLFAVYCAIFRKEKLSKLAAASLLLILSGVVLLLC